MKRTLSNNRGAALIEFAIVATLFFLLVFGIIEFGTLMKDYLTINQAVREGVRAAVVGNTDVESTVLDSAATLDPTKISNISVSYRIRTGGAWPTSWTQGMPTGLTDPDIQIKVGADYSHALVTGGLFGSAPITIHGEMIMRKEL